MIRIKSLGFAVTLAISSFAFAGPNDSQLTNREQLQQDMQKNKQEIENAGAPQNSSSAPTKVNVDSWGINSTTRYDITNHLFGYSTILDSDTTYDGVKLTGFFNVAFYNPRDNNDRDRKKSRYVMGFESPVYELGSRAAVFLGGGATFGDKMGLYVDTGVDYHLFTWLKAQLGINYLTANGHISPQLSLGFTW